MSDGSSGSNYSSCECLAFDISQEFINNGVLAAKELLRVAIKHTSMRTICHEIRTHGWLSESDIRELIGP